MTIGSHQRVTGKSDERFTPRSIWEPLGPFDTDAATSLIRPWSIGRLRNVTPEDNALAMDWRDFGRTWLNPPFNRFTVGQFIAKMCGHNHGVLLVHVRTETEWFRPIFEAASALLFLAKRYVFHRADGALATIDTPGSIHFGKTANSGAPLVLASFGWSDADALCLCGIDGHFVPLRVPRSVLAAYVEQTWRQALEERFPKEGPVALADLYMLMADHPRARANRHWREKVRQKVMQSDLFERVRPGVYRRSR